MTSMAYHANFSVVLDLQTRLVLRDNGPWDKHFTITNDAEWVVAQVARQLEGRDLYYFDSEGELTRLLVRRGRFAGFAPAEAA